MYHSLVLMRISKAQWALAGSLLLTVICLFVQLADYHVGLFSHDIFLRFKICYLVMLCLSLFSTSCSLFASIRPFSLSEFFTETSSSSEKLTNSSKCGYFSMFPRRFVLLITSSIFSLFALGISLTPGTHHDNEDHLAIKQILQVVQTLAVGISVFLNVRAWLDAQNLDKLNIETPLDNLEMEEKCNASHISTLASLKMQEQCIASPISTLVSLEMREQCNASHAEQSPVFIEEAHQTDGEKSKLSDLEEAEIHKTGSSYPMEQSTASPTSTVVPDQFIGQQQCNESNINIEEIPEKSSSAELTSSDIENTKEIVKNNNLNNLELSKSSSLNQAKDKLSRNPNINVSKPLTTSEPPLQTSTIIPEPDLQTPSLAQNSEVLPEPTKPEVDLIPTKPGETKPRKMTEPFIMLMTENLAEKYKLNVLAGTSTIYRYSDNSCIVKVLQENVPQQMFQNEIVFFNQPVFFNSPYLVKLKSYAGSKSKKKYLISEHISPGKDLNRWLYTARQSLSALDRIKILVGISEGLALINNHDIIHNDIKPANVIIDQHKNPKILDFSSIQRTSNCSLPISTCDQVIGTSPYMSPERLKGEKPSVKADTFSFGVLLLEVLTGRDPAKLHDDDDLISWVREFKQNGRPLRDLLDPRTDGGWRETESLVVSNFVDLGLSCTNYRPDLRPDMHQVAQQIKQILDL